MIENFGTRLGWFLLGFVVSAGFFSFEVKAQSDADYFWTFSEIRSDTNSDNTLDYFGEEVSITGIANIETGLLHEHYLQAFVQNDSAGMSVFAMEIETPFEVGDSIAATGKIERYNGLAEVHIDSYRVFKTSSPIKVRPLSEVTESPQDYLGMLAEGEGKIIEKGSTFNGKYVRISTEGSSKSMMVYVSNFHSLYDQFDFDVLGVGDRISVKGIITEYNPEFPKERTFKLFLRTPEDLTFRGIPQFYLYLIAAASAMLIIVVVGWVISLKRSVNAKTKTIQANLEQKEVLLREIHHRVKNSLAIVSGLIHLQEGNTESREAKRVLQDTQARIQSVALVHEKLYKTESLSEIKLNTYIKDLVEAIHKTFTDYKEAVELKFEMEEVLLETERVIPCGLLINELVVNAYKHAFNKNKRGELRIRLKQIGDDIVLIVSDNGPGLPSGFDQSDDESLGAILINSFASRLKAGVQVNNREVGGAEYIFKFPSGKTAD
ncbi:sensor histidine kinase [Gracilimonas sp.]|uniref:sensor histidine kinase n=1 Tax=Gracilimonas sp. TaxID=1974203 RepID=UPI003D10650F